MEITNKDKTAVGKIIQGVIGTADKLLTGGNLTKVINAITGNKELTEQQQQMYIQEVNSVLLDVQQARTSNVKIQESANASFLAKNTAYILDIGVFLLIMAMMAGLFFVEIPAANKDLFNLASGSILGFMAATWAFHRGSSQGSRNKDLVN